MPLEADFNFTQLSTHLLLTTCCQPSHCVIRELNHDHAWEKEIADGVIILLIVAD